MKPIAFYYPEYAYINNNFIEFENKKEIINNQIQLAKNHGIYGFAINYIYIAKTNNKYDEIVQIILELQNFHFLLNWENSNLKNEINLFQKSSIKYIEILENIFEEFVNRIKKYLTSKIYIKFKKKPVLSLENPGIFENIQNAILTLRKKLNIEVFIICPFEKLLNHSSYTCLFDATFDASNFDFFAKEKKNKLILYYSGLIYKNILANHLNQTMLIFRSSILSFQKNDSNENSLKGYTPEKFYILNKIIINWTKTNYRKTKGIFFIKSWNDNGKGNYLQHDENFGYSSINSFSKALFNQSWNYNQCNLSNLLNMNLIAVQAHIFYKELVFEVINKTNNIPLKFDLFITTLPNGNRQKFEQNIKNYSKASKYEILYIQNKGRDILPFIEQMKNNYKKYKYICHIHTKKAAHVLISGENWRKYLYENLLGDSEKISQIIFDFENIKKLGIIFPEPYYYVIKDHSNFDSINFKYHEPNIKYMNFILNKLSRRLKFGEKLIFPVGDMFWAKIKSIYQIFRLNFQSLFPDESGQINETIMHAIERIWIYIVKKNGYFYKIIFNHY